MPRIRSINLWKYDLPLKQEILVRHSGVETKSLRSRKGLLLEVVFDSGICCYGEAAPLPGFHKESLDDCLLELEQFVGDSHRDVFSPSIEKKVYDLSEISSSLSGCSLFALESIPFLYQFCQKASYRFKTSFFGTPDFAKPGDYKIKIDGSKPESLSKLATILQSLPETTTIRLDANQTFSIESLREFWRQVPKEAIAYIEEPLANFAGTMNTQNIPIALDESLWEQDPQNHSFPKNIHSLVLKPSKIGGLWKTIEWIQKALTNNIKIYLSSAYESGASIQTYILLAEFFKLGDTMGYGTYHLLEEDVFLNPVLPAGQSSGTLRGIQNNLNRRVLEPVCSKNF